MYRIYNNALNIALKPFGVSSLDELSGDQLTKLASSIGQTAVPKKDTVRNVYYGIDIDTTLKKIEAYFTLSTYMGDGYWEERHMQKANAAEISPKLSKMRTGQEVFEIMARHKLGFYMLKPGMSADVDWTVNYLDTVFLKAPYSKYCEITDLETGKLYGKKEEVKEEVSKKGEELAEKLEAASKAVSEKMGEKVALGTLSRKELVEKAKAAGILKATFKPTEQLIKLLS